MKRTKHFKHVTKLAQSLAVDWHEFEIDKINRHIDEMNAERRMDAVFSGYEASEADGIIPHIKRRRVYSEMRPIPPYMSLQELQELQELLAIPF